MHIGGQRDAAVINLCVVQYSPNRGYSGGVLAVVKRMGEHAIASARDPGSRWFVVETMVFGSLSSSRLRESSDRFIFTLFYNAK